MKAAVFGAGNIGRGLVGEVLADSGYELTFIDADSSVVEMLTQDPSYEIRTSAGSRTVAIAGIVDAKDEDAVHSAVADADVVATAVGPAVLKIVAPAIGRGLEQRSNEIVNVLACENVLPNSSALKAYVVEACGEAAVEGVGFPDVVVDRIAPGAAPSRVVEVEPTFEFVVDQGDWAGAQPDGPIVFTPNLSAYKLRKLWLVNGLHVITAWLGLRSGHEYIHEAIADEAIKDVVVGAGGAMGAVLATRTDEFERENLGAYCARAIERFSNPALPDYCRRVARNPLLKLESNERVLTPARGAEELGIAVEPFAETIAAALALTDPDVEGVDALRQQLDADGWRGLLTTHSGVTEGGSLYRAVEQRMEEHEAKRGIPLITEQIVITNPSGLHARPAAEIVEAAKASSADIQIHKGEKAANAKSIMSVLALGANTGDTIQLTIEGDGADDILATLRGIMQSEEH